MKFKIVRSRFLEGLKNVQNIVSGKTTLPVLQNVLLDGRGKELTMTTTDMDISVRVAMECEIIEEGATTIPVKLLFNSIAKAAEGEVSIESDSGERATIKAGSAKFKLMGIAEVNFPRLPQDEDTYEYRIEQATLREMLRKVAYAASQDDTRRSLKGVMMKLKDQKITMVATDGRRLALVENEMEFPQNQECEVIIPAKTAQELERMLTGEETVLMKIQKSQISFKIGNAMVYSKLIDDHYPNYEQVIPKEVRETVEIERLPLIDALDRASVMTLDAAHSTKLSFSEGKLLVSSAVSDKGEAMDEVAIKYAGEPIDIVFNPSYVMDALKVIDDNQIKIKLNNGHSPALITCSVPFVYVLMPLRIG